jgi:uncharacterized protein (TIGR03067 family)
MIKNRWILAVLSALALLVVVVRVLSSHIWGGRKVLTPVPTQPMLTVAARQELDKLHGTWEFVSMEVEGVKKPEADFKKYRVVLEGDQWTVWEGTNIAAQTTMEPDPGTDPKGLDLLPRPGKGDPIRGIYLLEGDKLTYCDRGEDKGDRPTEFGTEPDSGLVLIVLRRVGP